MNKIAILWNLFSLVSHFSAEDDTKLNDVGRRHLKKKKIRL